MSNYSASVEFPQEVFLTNQNRSALDDLLGVGLTPEALLEHDDAYLTDAEWGSGESGDGWDDAMDYSYELDFQIQAEADEIEFERQLREAEAIARWPRETKKRYSIKKAVCHRIRWRVFKRDKYRCVRCSADEDLTVDHIVPQVHGGPDHVDNLQTLCRTCNCSKGAR